MIRRMVILLAAGSLLVCSAGSTTAFAADKAKKPAAKESKETKPAKGKKYICTMCPGVSSDKPGKCSKCGMDLKEEGSK